jgi:hypothetical protein
LRIRSQLFLDKLFTALADKSVPDCNSGSEKRVRRGKPPSGDSEMPDIVSDIMKRYGWSEWRALDYLKSREYFLKTDVLPLLEPHRDWLLKLLGVDGEKGKPRCDPAIMFALLLYQACEGLSDADTEYRGHAWSTVSPAFDLKPCGPNAVPSKKAISLFREKIIGKRRTAEIFLQFKRAWVGKFGRGNYSPRCSTTRIETYMKRYVLGPLFVRLIRRSAREAMTGCPDLFGILPPEFLRAYGFEMTEKNVLRTLKMKMTLPADMVFGHVGYLLWFASDRPELMELESFRALETVFHEHFVLLKGKITVWGAKFHKAALRR